MSANKGWSRKEIDLLQQQTQQADQENLPMRAVFGEMASLTGRKANSVRNFYYSACRDGLIEPRKKRRSPARPFDPGETQTVFREILQAKAVGESVRACTLRLANGDPRDALRLQNKYRALLRTQPEWMRRILREEGGARPAAKGIKRAVVERLAASANLPGVDTQALFLNLALLLERATANGGKVD